MSTYTISKDTYRIAKELNVKISVSKNKKKKIDIIDKEGRCFEIGDIHYGDFHTYQRISMEYANSRKKLYHTRNKKYINTPNSPAYYAARLLW